jgi:hypothetical protein
LGTPEVTLLRCEVVAGEELRGNDAEFRPDTAPPRRGERGGEKPGQEIDSNGRNTELNEHLGIQEVFDTHIGGGRSAEETSDCSNDALRVPSGRADVESEIFRRAGTSVERERMGSADQVPSACRVQLCEQLFEVGVHASSLGP